MRKEILKEPISTEKIPAIIRQSPSVEAMQEQLREKLPTPVSCSVGITLIRKDSYNYEDSIRQADKALYTAKHKGKDTYCYWEESEK